MEFRIADTFTDSLVKGPHPQAETLACAVALLANAMGSIREVKPIWCSPADVNARLATSHLNWALQDDLERIAIQVSTLRKPARIETA